MSKKFIYHISCVSAHGQDINDMLSSGVEIKYQTMLRACDLLSWAAKAGYEKRRDQGLTLRDDFAVSFHKGIYRGVPCYYLVHSAIEHIWVHKDANLPAKPPPRRDLLGQMFAGRFRT